jgi:hypothetical protein
MNFKKAVSLVTLSCFLISFLSGETLHATAEAYNNTEQVKRVLDGFTVPHTCGRITEVCVSSAAVSASGRKPVVVSIQDLHCNPEVQRNIAKILAELDKKYGLNRVYVEGGYGDVSTAWLCNIQDKALRKEVAEALLDQGKLTGTEYYSVMANRPALLKGLEDRALHQENVIRLGKILEKKDHFEAKLADLDRDLKYMEGKYLSSKNRDFNTLVAKHRRGRIDDDKYFQRLGKYVAAINDDPGKYNAILTISMADYPAISAYGELLRSAKHLRYDRIQRQMQRFVQLLKAKLPYSAYNDLMAKTDNFSRLDDLYIYLAKLAKSDTIISVQTGRRQFPDLYRFFDYVEKNQSVNPLTIVEEEKRLTEEIRIGLSRDTSELEVSFLEDFYGYFRNYLLNELTADDYNYFEQRFEKFQTIWGKYAVRNRILELKDDFTLLNAYYAVNCERNDRFLDNIGEARLSGAADTPDELLKNSDIIVIVAGGFHSAGLKELITAKNMPYITITPNATHGTTLSDALYTSLAREQAKVFASQSLALALGSTDAEVVSITKTRVKVLLNGVEVTLLRNEQEPDKLTIDPAWQQAVAIAGNVWNRDALELAINDAWNMSLTMQGFTNFAMTRELIYELMKIFARLGAREGIFGSNGLIWAIASDETVKQIISTREKISIEELGRLFEYFQAVIAGHAMQRETRGRIAKGSSFIEAVMAVAEQHLLSLSAEDQRKPGEGLAVDGDIVRFYTSPDSDGKTVYEKWDTAEDVGTRVTPAAYSPGYQREMVSLFETLLKTGEDRMLSVGAGVGRIESMLQKEKGYKNIVVTDVMPEAVALLKEKGLNALLADGRKLPELPLERFEVVYMDGSLGHMASSFETISEDGDNFRVPLMEMNRALADYGTIVISDDIPPEGQAYEINPRVKFLRLNDVTMTRELEGAGFTVREIRDIFYERPGLGKVPRRVIIARKTGYRGAGQGAAEDFLAQLNRDLSGFKPSQREKLFVAALRELDDRREEEFIQLKDTIRNMAIQNAAEAVRETGLAPYSFHRTSMLIWGIHVDGQNPVLEIAKERVRKGFENEIRYRQFEINIDHKIAREYHFGPLRLSQREKLDTPYEFKDGHITYYGVRLQYDAGEVSSTLTAKRYHGYYFPHLMSGQEDETEAYSELRMNPIALKYCPGGCVFCERLKNVLPTKDEADNPYKITPEELVERIVREHPGKLAKVDKAKLITDSLGKEEDALKYLEKLARLLRENGFKGTLHFAGYEIQTPEGLQRLRKAGWSYFNLTVEVFSRRKEIIRGVKYIPLQGAFDILRRAKTIGFDKVVISYIAGLDTLEEFETDIKQLRSEGLIAALASNIMVPFASHHEKLVIPEGKDIGYYVQLNRILRENGLPVYQPEDYEKGLFQVLTKTTQGLRINMQPLKRSILIRIRLRPRVLLYLWKQDRKQPLISWRVSTKI